MNCDDIKIRRRDMNFDFATADRFWNGGHVYRTVFFNSLSIMLPEGERYMIKVARQVLPLIKDEKLREDARGFIAQEAAHSAQHRLYNDRLRELGYPVDKMERFVRRQLNLGLKYLPLKWNAAMSACYEHYTALIGDATLSNRHWLDGADNGFGDLWRWHAVEEIEHKAVTFDVYKATGGGYFLRSFIMFFLTLNFLISLIIIQITLLKHDKKLLDWPMWKQAVKFIFAESGLFSKYLFKYFSFFRPRFHPWNDHNEAIIKDWIAEHDK